MIYELSHYEEMVQEVLRKIGVLRTRQLITMLIKSFEDVDVKQAQYILGGMQRRGYLLLNEDGWAMNKRALRVLTSDKRGTQIKQRDEDGTYNPDFFLPNQLNVFDETGTKVVKKEKVGNLISRAQKELVDCLWVAAQMYPDAKDFVTGSLPWNISFVTEPTEETEGKLFQVVKFSAGMESAKAELMKQTTSLILKSDTDYVRRVAVVDDEEKAWKVPYLGFVSIVKINEDLPSGYEVIDKTRTQEELWKDYVTPKVI